MKVVARISGGDGPLPLYEDGRYGRGSCRAGSGLFDDGRAAVERRSCRRAAHGGPQRRRPDGARARRTPTLGRTDGRLTMPRERGRGCGRDGAELRRGRGDAAVRGPTCRSTADREVRANSVFNATGPGGESPPAPGGSAAAKRDGGCAKACTWSSTAGEGKTGMRRSLSPTKVRWLGDPWEGSAARQTERRTTARRRRACDRETWRRCCGGVGRPSTASARPRARFYGCACCRAGDGETADDRREMSIRTGPSGWSAGRRKLTGRTADRARRPEPPGCERLSKTPRPLPGATGIDSKRGRWS